MKCQARMVKSDGKKPEAKKHHAHHMTQPAWKKPDPKVHHAHLTDAQEAAAKRWAASHHVPYPSLVANMHACKMKKKK